MIVKEKTSTGHRYYFELTVEEFFGWLASILLAYLIKYLFF